IGEAFPHLGREQERQSTRVSEEIVRSFAAPTPLLSRRESHDASLRVVSRYTGGGGAGTLERASRRRQTEKAAGRRRHGATSKRNVDALDAGPDMRKTLCRQMPPEDFAMLNFKASVVKAAVVVLAAIIGDAAAAQGDPAANFPNKPIRLIVGFAAGGGNDLFARLV